MAHSDAINHCDTCNLIYEGGFSAWVKHNASKDHQMLQYTDNLIHHINYVADRMAELNREVKLRPIVPVFNAVKTCPKCGRKFSMVTPTTRYKASKNIMERGCHMCGATWIERCADGSEPIWEELK